METKLTTDALEDARLEKNRALEKYRGSRGLSTEDRQVYLDGYVRAVADYEHIRAILSDKWLAERPELDAARHLRQPIKHPDQLRQAVDMVNEPPHYTADADIECIDAIEAALGPDGFRAFCRGNAIKYIWRCELKGNAEQDIKKAGWYIDAAGISYATN